MKTPPPPPHTLSFLLAVNPVGNTSEELYELQYLGEIHILT